MNELARLRVYRFEPGAVFDGGLLGAIERMQLGHGTELLDALFVRRDAASSGLEAVDLAVGGGGGTFASLLDFRLEPRRRRAITERTLAEHPGGVPRPEIELIGAALEAGAALLAVLSAGGTAMVLEEAVARCGGRLIADEPVDARARAGRPATARGRWVTGRVRSALRGRLSPVLAVGGGEEASIDAGRSGHRAGAYVPHGVRTFTPLGRRQAEVRVRA
jgi:hypothetical protein